MKDGNIYVLMVTARKTIAPALAPATPQGAIDAMCSFETFPAAVSDDVEALREHAKALRDRLSTIDGWNIFEVPAIGGAEDGE